MYYTRRQKHNFGHPITSEVTSSVSATCLTVGSISCLKMSLAKDDSTVSLRLSFPLVALVQSHKTDVVLYRILGQMLAGISIDASKNIYRCQQGYPGVYRMPLLPSPGTENRCSHVCSVLYCFILRVYTKVNRCLEMGDR